MRKRDFKHLFRELKDWPGATLRLLRETKHAVWEVAYDGETTRMVTSASRSDNYRGQQNQLKVLRQLLQKLGAKKHEE